jgi:hypothetical protein
MATLGPGVVEDAPSAQDDNALENRADANGRAEVGSSRVRQVASRRCDFAIISSPSRGRAGDRSPVSRGGQSASGQARASSHETT